MYRLGILLVVCVGLAAPFTQGQQPKTSPDQAQVKKLIEQLGSPSFMEREKARVELEKMGPAILPALQEAMKCDDAQISTLVAGMIQKMDDQAHTAKLLAPKRVMLNVKDMPVTDVIQELNKQSGYNIQVTGDLNAVKRKEITLDTKGPVPFWQAFDMLCDKAGLAPVQGVTYPSQPSPVPPYSTKPIKKGLGVKGGAAVPANPPAGAAAAQMAVAQIAVAQPAQVQLQPVAQPGPAFAQPAIAKQPYYPPGMQPGQPNPTLITVQASAVKAPPTCYSGAVRIQLSNPVLTKDELQLTLHVQAEPSVDQFGLVGTPLVQTARDDHGQLLNMVLQQGNTPVYGNPYSGKIYYPPNNQPITSQQTVHLKLGEKAPKQLKEFKGVLTAQILLPTSPVVSVKGIMKENLKPVNGNNGGAINVQSVKKLDAKRYQIDASIEPPPGMNNNISAFSGLGGKQVMQGNEIINGHLLNAGPNSGALVLVDAQGKAFNLTSQFNKGAIAVPGKGIVWNKTFTFEANADQGEPEQLVLVGRAMDLVSVPFRFENLPLP